MLIYATNYLSLKITYSPWGHTYPTRQVNGSAVGLAILISHPASWGNRWAAGPDS